MVNSTNLIDLKYAATADTENFGDVFELSSIYGNNMRWKPGREARCCAFSIDGSKFAWSTGHGSIKIVNYGVGQSGGVEYSTTTGDSGRVIDCVSEVMSMEFAPHYEEVQHKTRGSSLLAVGLGGGNIKIVNSDTGELVFNLSDHHDSVKGLTFSPCGIPLLISCSLDKTLKVWDLEDDGNMTLTIKGHKLAALDCAFSPSNPNILASVGMGKSVIIWTFQQKRSCKLARNLIGHNNDVVSCSWTPDGALLATASHDTTVIIWDPHLGDRVIVLGHLFPLPSPIFAGGANGAWVVSVSFSKDGTKLATVCEDDRVRMWRLWRDDPQVVETSLTKCGYQCRFSPDSRTIAVGKQNGSVTLASDSDCNILSLKHLSRTAARRIISSHMIESLLIPQPIKQYLAYRYSLD